MDEEERPREDPLPASPLRFPSSEGEARLFVQALIPDAFFVR